MYVVLLTNKKKLFFSGLFCNFHEKAETFTDVFVTKQCPHQQIMIVLPLLFVLVSDNTYTFNILSIFYISGYWYHLNSLLRSISVFFFFFKCPLFETKNAVT